MFRLTQGFLPIIFIAIVAVSAKHDRNHDSYAERHATTYLTTNNPSYRAARSVGSAKPFRAVLIYTYDHGLGENGIEKYEVSPDVFNDLISNRKYISTSQKPKASHYLIDFFDGKCDVSIDCRRPPEECSTVPCVCTSTTPMTSTSTRSTSTSKPSTSTSTPRTSTSTSRTSTSTSTSTPRTSTSTSRTSTSTSTSRTSTSTSTSTPRTSTSTSTSTPRTSTSTSRTSTSTSTSTPRTSTSTSRTFSISTSTRTKGTTTSTGRTYIPPVISYPRYREPRYTGTTRRYTGTYRFGFSWKPFTGGYSWRSRIYSRPSRTPKPLYYDETKSFPFYNF